MKVVLGDVEQNALDAAVVELGDGITAICCDVTSQASVDGPRDAAVDRFGAVHVVCLNADVAPIDMLLDPFLETWRWVLDVNVIGVAHGIQCS